MAIRTILLLLRDPRCMNKRRFRRKRFVVLFSVKMKAFLESTFAGSPFLWYSGVHFSAVIRITRNICNIVKDKRRLIVKKYLDVVWKAAHVSRMIGEPKEMSDLVAEYGKIVPSSSK